MAKLKIFKFPDLVLAQKARAVDRVEKGHFRLTDDMLETMYSAPGIGLAANQVGILERILVLDTDYDFEELPEGARPPEGAEVVDGGLIKNRKPRVIINPEIILKEGNILFSEGCLSVPDFSAEVKRAEKIKLKYLDIDGNSKTLLAEGLLAVAIQHEIDHLEGKLFIDRLNPLKKEMIKKRLRKEREERDLDDEDLAPPKKPKTKGF